MAADEFIEKLAGITVLGEEEDTEGLSKSITNLAKFLKELKYNVVLRTLRATLKSQVMVSGVWHDKADVIGSMFTHTATMYNVAHTPKPSPEQIKGVVSAAARLRATFVALGVKGTPWGHVWTCHVPQFLVEWGTLYPFLCHGFEGRWRDLKAEIKHSTHGQWRGARVGFETVIRYSLVLWTLLKLDCKLVGRSWRVGRGNEDLWSDFEYHMSNLPPP